MQAKTDLATMAFTSREVLIERFKNRVDRMNSDMKLADTILELIKPGDSDKPELLAQLGQAKKARDGMAEQIGELMSVLHWLEREPA